MIYLVKFIILKLIAQWLSGLKLRLNEVKDKFCKLNQVIVIKVKAQWLSGIKLRLNDLFDTYSTVRGVNRRSENHLIFYFWSTPNMNSEILPSISKNRYNNINKKGGYYESTRGN